MLRSLELAHRVNAVILDKTGTITEGKPGVTDFVWNDKHAEHSTYRQVLYAMESRSTHPLAKLLLFS